VQLSLALGCDVSASSGPLRLADAVLKHETLEPGILRVETNPGVTVEVLACVDVETGKILVPEAVCQTGLHRFPALRLPHPAVDQEQGFPYTGGNQSDRCPIAGSDF
jgi:hypothetical protein